ncbi:hypothetical protein ACFYXM_27500 [Streptomyces sp. NPDC002476]
MIDPLRDLLVEQVLGEVRRNHEDVSGLNGTDHCDDDSTGQS